MRTAATAVALTLAVVACGGPGTPALEAPDLAAFDTSALIDVLPPDTIRSIRDPAFESIDEGRTWLSGQSPVIALEVEDEARAYPLAILTRHEIVNDRVGGRSVAVTYCPLCNSAVVYDRVVRDITLTFVVSGKLYHSDLVLLDQQTKSLWPQLMGRAVLGELKGARLTTLASTMLSFEQFIEAYPAGRVLARPADASYGINPYEGYDSRERPYGDFFPGEVDPRLDAMERVVGVSAGPVARAYPHTRLARAGRPAVVHDRIGEEDIVVFYDGEQRSALDAPVIADGRRVGSSGVFSPLLGERTMRFTVRDGAIVDESTGSEWSVAGVATAGPLAGERLQGRVHVDSLWFAWAAFVPSTEVWSGAV